FDGSFTQKVKDKFTPLVAAAIKDAIRDMVSQRLTSALEVTSGARPPVMPTSEIVAPASLLASDPEVETTDEEIEAYHIIKALVRNVVKSDRIVMRDAKSYCAILIDDNNRRPLARLHFNAKSTKYLGLFTGKDEEKIRINSVDDIYSYADRLQQTAAAYGAG
ncbi:MAG TPA: hypothetical protein VEB20_17520, partial [Azospirillaceae bacterium]|nr:hypothetical protein [Azospirillaceae bacterium]